MDSYDESGPVHSSSTSEVPHMIEIADIRGHQAMPRTIAAVARKKFGWMTKTSRAVSGKDFPVDKEQKRIVDQ